MNGILNIYKEAGYTSHDVVAKLRRILGQKKIGHTGTLDPQATGVLPVCLGKATKLCDLIGNWDKSYRAVLLLGVETDTEDIFGTVLKSKDIPAGMISGQEITQTMMSFVGKYDQVPPMYSAKKVKGKKLYELARQGIEIEREPARVEIKEIRILKICLPYVTFEVECSKGTYIRSLCRDIGKKLNVGGCMSSLVRTRVAEFREEDALTLSEVEEAKESGRLKEVIKPIDSVFLDYPKIIAAPAHAKLLQNGNPLPLDPPVKDEIYRMYNDKNQFIGLYKADQKSRKLRPYKMFFDEEIRNHEIHS